MPESRPVRTDQVDLKAIRHHQRYARWLARYFRYSVHGLERVPAQGPALLVLNHGILPVDALLLGSALVDHHHRVPRALMDRIFNRLPILRETLLGFGAVEGRPDVAVDLLQRGNLVMVFPGGAREAFKSTAQRYTLLWDDREGFARVAVQAGVPVIPSVCIGIDDLYLVFNDGYAAGHRWTGVKSLPLPLALGLGPLPFPVRLTAWIGEAIHPPAPSELPDQADRARVLQQRVREAMDRLLADGLAQRRSLL